MRLCRLWSTGCKCWKMHTTKSIDSLIWFCSIIYARVSYATVKRSQRFMNNINSTYENFLIHSSLYWFIELFAGGWMVCIHITQKCVQIFDLRDVFGFIWSYYTLERVILMDQHRPMQWYNSFHRNAIRSVCIAQIL